MNDYSIIRCNEWGCPYNESGICTATLKGRDIEEACEEYQNSDD